MFIIPLCLFLISTYLRPRTQAGLSALITAVECLSGLWCVLFAPFNVQIPLLGFLLIRNRKAIRAIWFKDSEEENYLDLSNHTAPTIDVEATPIENLDRSDSIDTSESETAVEEVVQLDNVKAQSSQLPTANTQAEHQDPPSPPTPDLTNDREIRTEAEPRATEIHRMVLEPFSHHLAVSYFGQISAHPDNSRHQRQHTSIFSIPGIKRISNQTLFQIPSSQSTQKTDFIQISF